MMTHLVKHCFPDLGLQLLFAEVHGEVRLTKHDNSVWQCPKIVITFIESDPLIDTENISQIGGGLLLDYNDQVVDLLDHPLREAFKCGVDHGLEFRPAHLLR